MKRKKETAMHPASSMCRHDDEASGKPCKAETLTQAFGNPSLKELLTWIVSDT